MGWEQTRHSDAKALNSVWGHLENCVREQWERMNQKQEEKWREIIKTTDQDIHMFKTWLLWRWCGSQPIGLESWQMWAWAQKRGIPLMTQGVIFFNHVCGGKREVSVVSSSLYLRRSHGGPMPVRSSVLNIQRLDFHQDHRLVREVRPHTNRYENAKQWRAGCLLGGGDLS